MKKKNLGFTMIELIVVIAILGLLSTVGLLSFRNAQIKGRDAQRKNDLAQIQKGLEMYLSDHQSYPLTDDPDFPLDGGIWRDPDEEQTIYMKEIPRDSKFGVYAYSSDGASYVLCARLENEEDPQSGSCPGLDCNGEDCNYGVTSSNYTE